MTHDEFKKIFIDLLDQDSPRGGYSSNQRTLTDREAEVFRDHLWEVFFTRIKLNLTEDRLCQALLKTRRKYDSEQDRAAAILLLINTPQQPP